MKTVFVSSTFRDFQWERDALHDQVLPFLNQEARAYGQSVSFCDLRWGVDTSSQTSEEESSAKVLSVCMNEIDRARPYMLVLLGERYGFMPGQTAIAREGRRKAMTLQDLEISVTALEVEYGALRDQESLRHTWFYFRELTGDIPADYLPESEAHRRKLEELKARVRRLAGDRVRFYRPQWGTGRVTGLEDFVRQVRQDMLVQLREEWAEYRQMDPYQRDAAGQRNYLREKLRSFSVFDGFARDLAAELAEGDGSLVALAGPAGSGKSTMLARVCQLMEDRGFLVLPFFGGSTSLSTDAAGILRSLVWQLESRLGWPHLEGEDPAAQMPEEDTAARSAARWRERLDQLCAAQAERGPVLIAVDALDQLQASPLRDTLGFLPAAGGRTVRCLVTCLAEHPLPSGIVSTTMPAMTLAERYQVVDSALTALGKELSRPVVEALTAKPQGNNPLYLYLAVSRLCLMDAEDFQAIRRRGDGMGAITAQQLALVEEMPGELERLGVELIRAVGQRVSPAMAEAAFRCLAVSRQGLRLEDLEAVLGEAHIPFSPLTFAQLVNYMNELFLLRADGRYDFLHKSLRCGLLAELTARGVSLRAEHQRLRRHLFSLPDEDPVLLQEGTWEAMAADDPRAFAVWMTHVWKNEAAVAAAGRDVAAFCRGDGGRWMVDLLASPMLDELGENVATQVCFLVGQYFLDAFGDDQEELRLKLLLAGAATARLEEQAAGGKENARLGLIQSCQRYGELLAVSARAEERQRAVPMLERSRSLIRAMLEEQEDPALRLRLGDVTCTLARLYLRQGTREGFCQAEGLGRETLALLEPLEESDRRQKVLLNARMVVAFACICLGDRERLDQALPLTQAGVETLRMAAEECRESGVLLNLSRADTYMCQLCMALAKQGEEDRRQEAVFWAQAALDRAEEGRRLHSTADSRRQVAAAWNNLAAAHALQDTTAELGEAVCCQENSLRSYVALARELRTPEARHQEVNAWGRLGLLYDRQQRYGDALEAYLSGIEEAERLVQELPTAQHGRQLVDLTGRAVARCMELGGRERLRRGGELFLREAVLLRTQELSAERTEGERWPACLEGARQLALALTALPEDRDRQLGVELGVLYLKESKNGERRGELFSSLYTLCSGQTRALMGRPEEALPWAEGQLALLESLWPENRSLRPHLAAAHRDRGYLLLELGQLEAALAAARQALEILGQPEDHMERQLRWNICTVGCGAAERLWPQEESLSPEHLFFLREEVSALQPMTEEEDREELWRRLNIASWQLGDFYWENGQRRAAADMVRLETAAGERLLRFAQDRGEPLAEYWQDVSAASYRAAEWLCALEDSSALAEARSYALRDVELTRLLHQTDPAGTAEDLAASLRQLARIKRLQGESDEAALLEEIRRLESGKSE